MTREVRVEPVTGMSEALAGLACRTPFMPHRWLRPDAPQLLSALVRHRLTQRIGEPGNQAWSASVGAEVHAVAVLRPLAWDSRVLEIRAGRIDLLTAGGYDARRAAVSDVLRRALFAAKAAGIRHVSVRLDCGDDGAIHELERHGFLNVDALATFGIQLQALGERSVPGHPGDPVRLVAVSETERIGEIAAESFCHGRFHADPDISPEAVRGLYRQWAVACCEGIAADAVLVAGDQDGVRGFVACSMLPDTAAFLQRPAGTIVMIATTTGARGRGVGSRLVAGATAWFKQQGAAAIEVGTQLSNIRAARLYERCGFRLVSGAMSYRLLID